jgi:uncharacterized protein DUF6529
VIRVLNALTGGNLLLWKVIGATVVLLLAGVQVFLAARFWEVIGFAGLAGGTAARIHRILGRVALALAVLIALACVAGPAGPISPPRVLLHSVFGILVFVILGIKFLLLRVLRTGDRFLPLVGSALFLTFGAIWATSVADYVARR